MKLINADGKAIDSSSLPSRVQKAIDVCKKIPDDEGWDNRKLAAAMKCSFSTVKKCAPHVALKPYRVQVGGTVYWGNETSIKKEMSRKKSQSN